MNAREKRELQKIVDAIPWRPSSDADQLRSIADYLDATDDYFRTTDIAWAMDGDGEVPYMQADLRRIADQLEREEG